VGWKEVAEASLNIDETKAVTATTATTVHTFTSEVCSTSTIISLTVDVTLTVQAALLLGASASIRYLRLLINTNVSIPRRSSTPCTGCIQDWQSWRRSCRCSRTVFGRRGCFGPGRLANRCFGSPKSSAAQSNAARWIGECG